MASYNELLALIDAYINQNGVQAITGQVLNGVLRAMVDQLGRGYAIMGAADPTTDPGTPDGPETWFASVPGTYTNFDGIQIVPGELALLSYVPSTGFSKNTIYEGFQTVQATIDGNVGTPAVGVSYANGILSFDFHNMKGNPGNDGAPAGFGTVNATVDDQVGTPSVSVSSSGPDTAKNFTFAFRNLKGETGVTSVLATVDNTSGNPQCTVSLQNGQLTLAFTGLKGAQGDTGSSVDYPFTIVNNLTTNDATQALSAAMGVQLESEVSQLEAKVDVFVDGTSVPSVNLFDKTAITANKYVNSQDGGLASSSTGWNASDYIDISGLDAASVYITKQTAYSGAVGWAFYNSSKVYTHGASNNNLASFQEGDVYFRFSVKTADLDTAMITPGGASDVPSEYVPYGIITTYKLKDSVVATTNIEDSAIKTQKIADRAVEREKTDFIIERIGKNKCNPEDPDFKLNYQITSTTGNEYEWTGENAGRVGCTGYIPVSENGLILNHYGELGGLSGMAVYDANKVYIRGERTGVYTYQSGDAYVRFTFDYAYRNEIQVEEGSTITAYEPYSAKWILDPNKVETPPVSDEQILEVLPENGYYPNTIKINLPDKIYAVRGDKLQIFYHGVVVVPNIELYDIVVSCSVGKGLYRYFEYDVPVDATLGSKDWAISVKDANGNVLGTKTIQLIIVDKGQSPASNKNILCIGDSLTANGIWASELKRRLLGTSGTGTPVALGLTNLSFIGSKSVTPAGMGQVNIEGNSGWAWRDYALGRNPKFRFYLSSNDYTPQIGDVYTNNGYSYTVDEVNEIDGVLTILTSTSSISNTPDASGTLTRQSGSGTASMNFTSFTTDTANPFWDGNTNKLSFVNYVENVCNLPVGTKIDFAYILMTWNGVPQLGGDWDTFMAYAKDVIDALHADYPDCKVKLMGVEFVYRPTFISAVFPQDSMQNNRRVAKMNELYQELANSNEESGTSGDAYNTFVEFVNVSTQLDSKYNMTNTELDANTRNSNYKERYTNNSIHPATPGYLQIADIAYRNICNELQ